MTLLKSKLFALLLALTFAGSALAAPSIFPTTPGVITATGSFHNDFAAGIPAFDDFVWFSIAPGSGGMLSWAALSTILPGVTGLTSLSSDLYSGHVAGIPLPVPAHITTGIDGALPIPGSPFAILGTYGVTTPLALAPGDYTLHMFGTVAPAGGSYAGTITLAVPEPGEWALFLSGIGLIGLMVRRRMR